MLPSKSILIIPILLLLTVMTGFCWRFVLPQSSNELSGHYFKLGLGFNVRKFLEHKDNKWFQYSE